MVEHSPTVHKTFESKFGDVMERGKKEAKEGKQREGKNVCMRDCHLST